MNQKEILDVTVPIDWCFGRWYAAALGLASIALQKPRDPIFAQSDSGRERQYDTKTQSIIEGLSEQTSLPRLGKNAYSQRY